ncbi:MAG: efflux RND transporter permease subunit [Gemmatimonadetes bacterium]|nr:efflux RND transporter permease subunit [Gemmatimonadota bacterium]MCY3942288.1 efflux RND transporter permease subunit [Gemmatimonadota bacterium]
MGRTSPGALAGSTSRADGTLFDRMVAASLRHRLLTVCGAVLAPAAGGWAAATLPVDVFPDLTAPTVTVLADAHGMAPEEVESLVTFPVEASVTGAPGVRRVRSSSAQGISLVWVDFDWGTEIFRARQVVAERLQLAAAGLPDGVGPPVLAPASSIMGEIMLVGLAAPPTLLMDARTAADWIVRPRLLALSGVAQVVPIGGDVRQYQVLVDPARLRAYRVGLDEVLRAAAESNVNVSGGLYESGGGAVAIRGIGRVREAEEIGLTVIRVRGGVPILVRDVAEVRIGPGVRLGTGSVNATGAVVLSIQKQPGANTLDLTRRIDAELDAIAADLPRGVTLEREIFRQADFISLAVENVFTALWEGAALVVAILLLFLWSVRTAAISVLAIPLSLSLAVLALHALGGTINTMTLGGMAIAIGALVDDAVIFVENAHRRLGDNARLEPDLRRSALAVIASSAREIRTPILNATVIITIVFVPLFFLSGVEGRMLRPLGVAYIVSILASLLVAVTITPVLCHRLLPPAAAASKGGSWLMRTVTGVYAHVLDWTLPRPRLVVATVVLLLAGTLAIIPILGRSFLPAFQEGSLTISVVSLPGTSLAEADAIGTRVERQLLAHPAVASTSRRTGRAELDEHAQAAYASEIDARLDLSDHDLAEVMAELRHELEGLPGTNVTVGQPIGHRIDHMLSGTRAAIAANLFGPDLAQLRELAAAIEAVADEVPGLVDVAADQQAEVPQLQIQSDRHAMARHGVTPGALARAVDVAFRGEEVSVVREGQRSFDLVVRYGDEHRRDAVAIGSSLVTTPTGATVPLSQLATIAPARGPNAISRQNARRMIAISANVAGRDVEGAVAELQARVEEEVALPRGYQIEYGGQFESGRAAARTISVLSVFSIAAIFLILFQSFGSLGMAALLMVNLPLALVGGVLAVWVTGTTINVATLVGLISLFGIAVRNGILLVARYRDLEAEGAAVAESVRRGSLERLAPVLMTALTAGLALVPLALGMGEPGKELQAPLAVVVLGGLLTSTFLNMLVVPTLFLHYGRRQDKTSRSPYNV